MAKTTPSKEITKKHKARIERESNQRRILVSLAIAVFVLVAAVLVYGVLDQTVLQQQKPVAKVGDDTIRVGDFQKQVKFNRWQLIQQYTQSYQIYQMFASDANMSASILSSLQQLENQLAPENASYVGDVVLNKMIEDTVIAQEAERRGITVSPEELDEYFQAAFRYYPNGTPTATITPTLGITSTLSSQQMTLVPPTVTPTEAPATPTLAFTETATPAPAESGDVTATPTLEPTATSTPYTEEGYRGQVQTLVAQVNPIGIAEADIRDIFYYQLLREKVTEAITADLKPEQEQVWARHILVEDEDTAKEIKQRLDDGEDFAAVAAEVSQDTSNKDSGGDLGWFSKGQMDAGFEEAAFSLEVGQISDPVQSAYGWHIIQVLGHEVRPLDGSAFQTYKTQQFNDWLQQAVTDANVQRYDIINSVVPTEPDIPLELQTNG